MEKIAIIGLSCLFPGSTNPEEYWQNLIKGEDLTSLATANDMGVDANIFYSKFKNEKDKYYCLKGGYIRDFKFDTNGYGIAPELLSKLDDLYKWSLHVSKEALQDSGYFNNLSVLSKCGIILGKLSFPTKLSHHQFSPIYQATLDSALRELLDNKDFHLQQILKDTFYLNGLISGYPATVISQALSLSEMNLCLDAACASSLYAIKLACEYLLSGKANLMLAGAVSCADPLFINMGFSIFQAYAEDGTTRPLDRSSGGLIAGEGAAMVALKRYRDALQDGDRIYATITGIGLSNDGRGKFVLSPNPKGQILAFERAYTDAGINPKQIDYIECHATGTSLGDVTEINSMATFFGRYDAKPLLGSVKSNLGHLLTAAGMASLIKVILSMEKKVIPPTIHLEEPLSSENGAITADRMMRVPTPWPHQDSTKRAAISAFGFGGTNAHLILESSENSEGQKQLTFPVENSKASMPLAIIGMDAYFGTCNGLEEFNRSIYTGTQHFIPLPSERWQGIESQTQLLQDKGLTSGKAPEGAYIPSFEFDFLRFKTPPCDEDRLIPQQLLLLKVVDRAIKDAGIAEGSHVAVLVAMGTELSLHQFRGRVDLSWQIQKSLQQVNITLSPSEVAELESIAKDSLHPSAKVNQYTSFIGNIMACRIASLWNFSGPALTISAEENSVFRALEVAELLLRDRGIEAVVVGAVDLAGGVENVLQCNSFSPMNTGVHTLSYDSRVNGWTVGEGAGAIVVKRHETAMQKGDRIYAVIDAISLVPCTVRESINSLPVSHSAASVIAACRQSFEAAGVRPSEIGYLEVFGSGIAAEDSAEIQGLIESYQSSQNSEKSLTCCIGSIKANIGHTYVASGMASLIKTALCLYHRYLPTTPQWSAPKQPEIWQNSCFYVLTRSQTWFLESSNYKRKAAINGLGLDGTCAHLILSEVLHQPQPSNRYLQPNSFYLFPLAGNNTSELQAELNFLQQAIDSTDSLSQVATQTYQKFQQSHQKIYKLAIVGSHRDELLKEINLAVPGIERAISQTGEWKTLLGSYFTAQPLGNCSKIAFVYPGMGSADIEIGQDVFQLFPGLYDKFESLTENISQTLHEKLIYPRSFCRLSPQEKAKKSRLFFSNGVAMCQSTISFSVLYTLILREYFRVDPQVACGYSLGEASSMWFALGVWRDAHHLYAPSATEALACSPLFQTELWGACTAGRAYLQLPLDSEPSHSFWNSYLLETSALEVQEILKFEPQVYITFINSPQEVVIAGDAKRCLSIIKQLNCSFFPIPFNSVLHCDVAKSRYQELVKLHSLPIQQMPEIQFYSSVKGDRLSPLTMNEIAKNSAQLCCQKVDFPRLVQRVYDDGAKIFIEVGSKNNYTKWISKILKSKTHLAVSTQNKGIEEIVSLVRLLAQLVCHGVQLDLSPFYHNSSSSEPTHNNSILGKVALGGKQITNTILTEGNKSKFQDRGNRILGDRVVLNVSDKEFEGNSLICSNLMPEHLLRILQLQIANSSQQISECVNHINKQYKSTSIALPPQPLLNHLLSLDRPTEVIWDEADLLEFAQGKIATVFGSEYQSIDAYDRRVRLPTPPYLLVSRVTDLQAEKGKFKPSSITTEYDIPHQAWYSVDGQVPWAITVESGQCDLLLISYLGIDFQNQGEFVYRLLDCTLTFLAELPKEGDTLRYEIKINSFVKTGNNLLFFFSYECFVKNVMILKMDGGCAGFFSDSQLEQGKGLIVSDRELEERKKIKKQNFEPLLVCQKSTFNKSDILNLSKGDIGACFGEHYCQYGLNPSLRLPPEKILMLDRVTSIDPTGGDWGLGLIIAEKYLDPEHWYFPCHFKDDRVMAGSLMAEGCGQLLQFYLLYLGLHTSTLDARFQPIVGLPQVVRCRGQVTPIHAKLIYRMEVTEISLKPQPYAKCNVDIILHDKIVVSFQDLGLKLSEKSGLKSQAAKTELPTVVGPPSNIDRVVLLTKEHIQEFCTGSFAKCFGSEYAIYDSGKLKVSRIPNTHLNLVDRVLKIQGVRHQFIKGSTIFTEYDMPIEPWYYRQNSSPTIPYSILMEIALQPCGFLSAYLGTTFLYPQQNLYFRNLDGQGHLKELPELRGKTIRNKATLVSSVNIQGMIVQSFTFQLSCQENVFYEGSASFGHFSEQALANQVGLDRGRETQPWLFTENTQSFLKRKIDLRNLETRNQYYRPNDRQPYYRLAQHQLDLLHEVEIAEGGGYHGKGYIYAKKTVNPDDWYFKCHFHLDPVMPGSLGVEAILQAMQVYAISQNLGKTMKSPRFVPVNNHQLIWKYRGQIPHGKAEMHLEINLSQIENQANRLILMGDASLWRSDLRIYEVKNIAISLVES